MWPRCPYGKAFILDLREPHAVATIRGGTVLRWCMGIFGALGLVAMTFTVWQSLVIEPPQYATLSVALAAGAALAAMAWHNLRYLWRSDRIEIDGEMVRRTSLGLPPHLSHETPVSAYRGVRLECRGSRRRRPLRVYAPFLFKTTLRTVTVAWLEHEDPRLSVPLFCRVSETDPQNYGAYFRADLRWLAARYADRLERPFLDLGDARVLKETLIRPDDSDRALIESSAEVFEDFAVLDFVDAAVAGEWPPRGGKSGAIAAPDDLQTLIGTSPPAVRVDGSVRDIRMAVRPDGDSALVLQNGAFAAVPAGLLLAVAVGVLPPNGVLIVLAVLFGGLGIWQSLGLIGQFLSPVGIEIVGKTLIVPVRSVRFQRNHGLVSQAIADLRQNMRGETPDTDLPSSLSEVEVLKVPLTRIAAVSVVQLGASRFAQGNLVLFVGAAPYLTLAGSNRGTLRYIRDLVAAAALGGATGRLQRSAA